MGRRSDVNHRACGLFQILRYSLEATVHQKVQSVVHDQWADEVRNHDISCSLTVMLPFVINRTVEILHLDLCMIRDTFLLLANGFWLHLQAFNVLDF